MEWGTRDGAWNGGDIFPRVWSGHIDHEKKWTGVTSSTGSDVNIDVTSRRKWPQCISVVSLRTDVVTPGNAWLPYVCSVPKTWEAKRKKKQIRRSCSTVQCVVWLSISTSRFGEPKETARVKLSLELKVTISYLFLYEQENGRYFRMKIRTMITKMM